MLGAVNTLGLERQKGEVLVLELRRWEASGLTCLLGKAAFQQVMESQSTVADIRVQRGRCLRGSDGKAWKVQSTVGGDLYCPRDIAKAWQGRREGWRGAEP